jgi:hypothetical protein
MMMMMIIIIIIINLGVEESHNIEHKKEKDRLKKEYIRRLRLILSTELSAKN